MTNEAYITVLMDDTEFDHRFITEHGLSLWIEINGKKILFDTGQSKNVIHNARTLGIDLVDADAIVISHGHYDHTGGLASILKINKKADIYLHPDAMKTKFSKKPDRTNEISISESAQVSLENRNIIWTKSEVKITPFLTITGQVPRRTDFEDVGGDFYLDQECTKPDSLLDDQAMVINSPRGLVVVVGCSHSGIVNILDYISELTGKSDIYALIGGMHLLNASPDRIEKTIESFQKYQIQKIVPLHCTGQNAMDEIKDAFNDKCLLFGAGDVMII